MEHDKFKCRYYKIFKHIWGVCIINVHSVQQNLVHEVCCTCLTENIEWKPWILWNRANTYLNLLSLRSVNFLTCKNLQSTGGLWNELKTNKEQSSAPWQKSLWTDEWLSTGSWLLWKHIPVEGSCEHGDEPSGSLKCREVLE
jgi:hypothetical protein